MILNFLNSVFPTLIPASSSEALIVVIRHFPEIHSTVVPLAEIYTSSTWMYVYVEINPQVKSSTVIYA